MRPAKILFVTSLMAGVIAVNACAPRPDNTQRIELAVPGVNEKKINDCRAGITQSQTTTVTVNSVEMCVAKSATLAPGATPEYNKQAVSNMTYDLTRDNGQITLSVVAGVTVADKIDDHSLRTLYSEIRTECLPKIADTFSREAHILLDVKLKQSVDTVADTGASLDLFVKQKTDTAPVSFGFRIWPDQTEFFISQPPQCEATCKDHTGADLSSCQSTCLQTMNQPFCRNLAKLVGHWIGINEPSTGGRCVDPSQIKVAGLGDSSVDPSTTSTQLVSKTTASDSSATDHGSVTKDPMNTTAATTPGESLMQGYKAAPSSDPSVPSVPSVPSKAIPDEVNWNNVHLSKQDQLDLVGTFCSSVNANGTARSRVQTKLKPGYQRPDIQGSYNGVNQRAQPVVNANQKAQSRAVVH